MRTVTSLQHGDTVTFTEINTRSVAPEEQNPHWWKQGIPFDEICKAYTHYLMEVGKLPLWERPWRPSFQRTRFARQEVDTGKITIPEAGEAADAITDMVTRCELYTGEGTYDSSGRDGLLAVYEFPDMGRMKVLWSRARGNR